MILAVTILGGFILGCVPVCLKKGKDYVASGTALGLVLGLVLLVLVNPKPDFELIETYELISYKIDGVITGQDTAEAIVIVEYDGEVHAFKGEDVSFEHTDENVVEIYRNNNKLLCSLFDFERHNTRVVIR